MRRSKQLLFPHEEKKESPEYRQVNCEKVNKALRAKGQPLKRQWRLYDSLGIVDGKKPYSYRQFCQKIDDYTVNRGESICHILRNPGENIEFDYAGKTLYLQSKFPSIPDTKVTIFVATLSYSSYFYAEGLTSCDEKNWIRACNNALWFFGGCTPIVTPDNAKIAVIENEPPRGRTPRRFILSVLFKYHPQRF